MDRYAYIIVIILAIPLLNSISIVHRIDQLNQRMQLGRYWQTYIVKASYIHQ